jgi:hypothetical protein
MRVAGVVLGALIGGVLFGWGTEYGPVFSDLPAERSVGEAVAKSIVFGLLLLGFGVVRLARERHDGQLG